METCVSFGDVAFARRGKSTFGGCHFQWGWLLVLALAIASVCQSSCHHLRFQLLGEICRHGIPRFDCRLLGFLDDAFPSSSHECDGMMIAKRLLAGLLHRSQPPGPPSTVLGLPLELRSAASLHACSCCSVVVTAMFLTFLLELDSLLNFILLLDHCGGGGGVLGFPAVNDVLHSVLLLVSRCGCDGVDVCPPF